MMAGTTAWRPLQCRIVFVPGIMERCTYWADVFVLKRLAK
jgi:hypothetical protein